MEATAGLLCRGSLPNFDQGNSRMLEGLYSAAAGMAAQQQRLDAVANDIANVSTTGYKKERIGFRDLLYTAAGRGAAAQVTRAPARPPTSWAARWSRARCSRPTAARRGHRGPRLHPCAPQRRGGVDAGRLAPGERGRSAHDLGRRPGGARCHAAERHHAGPGRDRPERRRDRGGQPGRHDPARQRPRARGPHADRRQPLRRQAPPAARSRPPPAPSSTRASSRARTSTSATRWST